jgi:hypothetical protein
MNLVFTMGVEDAYNHANQFREVFPTVAEDPLVANRFFPDSDHVFSDYSQRRRLMGYVADWLESTFPPPAAPKSLADPNTKAAGVDARR